MFSETSFLKISLQKVSNFPFSDQTWLEKYPIPIPERRTRNNEAVIKKVFFVSAQKCGHRNTPGKRVFTILLEKIQMYATLKKG